MSERCRVKRNLFMQNLRSICVKNLFPIKPKFKLRTGRCPQTWGRERCGGKGGDGKVGEAKVGRENGEGKVGSEGGEGKDNS